MTLNELKRIVNLLGPTGAIAGIKSSVIGRDDLAQLAAKGSISASDESTRDELIERLVSSVTKVELRSTDELLTMPFEDLLQYFNEVAPSNEDLLRIMKELNYKVSAEDKKHLRRFVARQISETALFSSVARRGRDSSEK